MYLLDSTALVEILKGTRTSESIVQQIKDQPLGISTITMFEILVGAKENEREKIRNAFSKAHKAFLDDEIAEISADLSKKLAKGGQTIDKMDLFIAATAIKHNATLVTLDNVFKRIPNLKVISIKA